MQNVEFLPSKEIPYDYYTSKHFNVFFIKSNEKTRAFEMKTS